MLDVREDTMPTLRAWDVGLTTLVNISQLTRNTAMSVEDCIREYEEYFDDITEEEYLNGFDRESVPTELTDTMEQMGEDIECAF